MPESMKKIVVTELEYHKAETVFRQAAGFLCIPAPADETGLSAKIRETEARYAIVGVEKYERELYESLPRGGVIARFGVGHDGIDKRLAEEHGILCCNTPGALDDSVAECAIGMMLSAARHLTTCAAGNQSGRWQPRVGSEMKGKTLAVVGCGKIGCKVAAIAVKGLAMKAVGYDVEQPLTVEMFNLLTDDFAGAVKDADVVSLHIPHIPATDDFIDRKKLRLMKSSAVLINTARGGVVDENDLYDAVATGEIAGAALDVYKTEPYRPQRPDKDLRELENVLMTLHIGSSTVEACERMATMALRNITLACEGRIEEMNLLREN